MAQKSTVTDFYKAFGQNVLFKSSQKLFVAQGHLLLLITIFVVFVHEGDVGVVNG
jgi:hypothetical protein